MILILLPLISFFHLSFCNGDSTPTVTPTTTTPPPPGAIKVRGGYILGHNLTFPEGNVTEYLGIPFAQPPYGYHRFLPPKELLEEQWEGTRECVTLAKSCMQQFLNYSFEGYNYTHPRKDISEDCLQLNMWVPVEKNENKTSVVFIFGDSFLYGSPSLDLNNGSVLALKSGAIIINLNYRLSIFGFAYLGADSMVKGNMGLLDQQMGLKWINENIDKFGGDNKSITIYGSGAGATSVTAHLFSNNSNGLFNRAIVSSGAITNIWQTNTKEIAYYFTITVAQILNCTNGARTDKEKEIINKILKEMKRNESKVDEDTKTLLCLQNKTTDQIVSVVYGLYNETTYSVCNKTNDNRSIVEPKIYTFLPMDNDTVFFNGVEPKIYTFLPMDNDTVFFNGSLWEKYKNKTINKDVDIIFGRTQDELTYLMPFMLQHMNCTFNSTLQQETISSGKKDDKKNKCLLNETDFEGVADMIADNAMDFNEENKDGFEKGLIKIYNKTKKPLKPRAKVARMMSDFFIHCRLAEFAEYYYNATNGSRNVYFYEYRKHSVINPWPKWMNPMHAWELEPVFGYPIRHPELYNKTKETDELKKDRRKRQMTESTTTITVKPDVNITFEQLFSNISMTTLRNYSIDGNPGDAWIKYSDENKTALVISGNLSGVNYTKPKLTRCVNLHKLIKKFEDMQEKMELEYEEYEEEVF
uniref:Acetylcholinesterase n=1 Tax=Strongyloides papillosus TaxID=174720 RepID=A0A0N5CHF3_STREA